MKMKKKSTARTLDRIGTRVLTKPQLRDEPRNRSERRLAERMKKKARS